MPFFEKKELLPCQKKAIFVKTLVAVGLKQQTMQAQEPNAPALSLPLSNLQLQLLKLYADGISDEDLKVIQRMIARYFADKASAEAQAVWEEKGYDAQQLLQENRRTPYKKIQP